MKMSNWFFYQFRCTENFWWCDRTYPFYTKGKLFQTGVYSVHFRCIYSGRPNSFLKVDQQLEGVSPGFFSTLSFLGGNDRHSSNIIYFLYIFILSSKFLTNTNNNSYASGSVINVDVAFMLRGVFDFHLLRLKFSGVLSIVL